MPLQPTLQSLTFALMPGTNDFATTSYFTEKFLDVLLNVFLRVRLVGRHFGPAKLDWEAPPFDGTGFYDDLTARPYISMFVPQIGWKERSFIDDDFLGRSGGRWMFLCGVNDMLPDALDLRLSGDEVMRRVKLFWVVYSVHLGGRVLDGHEDGRDLRSIYLMCSLGYDVLTVE